MGFEEFIVATVAIIFGTSLAAFIFAKIFGLIRLWLEGRTGGVSKEEYNRLGKAFVQHKKDAERRLEQLEAIVASDDQPAKQLQQRSSAIEIEDADGEQEDEEIPGGSGNLRNMLRE